METLHLIAHPAHPPTRVSAVAARIVSCDAHWLVLRWKVEHAAQVVVPQFAGRWRADGLWQTTCFELFAAEKALPLEGEGWVGVCDAQSAHDAARSAHPSPTPPLRGGANVAYSEFNFAPSERWAAYDFTSYRTGMTERAMARAPVITPRRGGDVLFCDVALPLAALPPLPLRYGLTAVIEEAGGVRSYWAMAHGERPDFHDPACLAGVLAAPVGA